MTRPNCATPAEFFGHLRWLDGRTLPNVIEPYRAQLLQDALWTFDPDGRPTYNLVLSGRGKKNWKSADLCFAALYRFVVWPSSLGNGCLLVANDEDQAGDDLDLIQKLVRTNPDLSRQLDVRVKSIVRLDGAGELVILPARDAIGAHGKTYLFLGWDEIHGHRNYDLMEALAPDPTRTDALQWITSYASLYNASGYSLHDLIKIGKARSDPRMLFSWYSGSYGTDPSFTRLKTPAQRANPSMAYWGNDDYLPQQKQRLHLNEPGAPTGAAFDADSVAACVLGGQAPAPGAGRAPLSEVSGGRARSNGCS